MHLVAPLVKPVECYSSCMSYDSMKKWLAQSPEHRARYNESIRRWGEKNPEKIAAAQHRYKSKPGYKEKRREQKRALYAKDPEKARAASRRYYANHGGFYGWNSILSAIGARARRDGMPPNTVTRSDLARMWDEQRGLCYWLGVPMVKVRNSPWKASLDRMDNSKGYTTDNVRLTTWFANRARNSMTVDEFSAALEIVAGALAARRVA